MVILDDGFILEVSCFVSVWILEGEIDFFDGELYCFIGLVL